LKNVGRVILDPSVTVPGPLHGLQIAVPRWSPDGKRLSFIGGLMSDQGSTGGDVWVIDADGKHLFDATPNIDGTPTFAVWTATTPQLRRRSPRPHAARRLGHPKALDAARRRTSTSAKSPSPAVPSRTPFQSLRIRQRRKLAFVKSGFNKPPKSTLPLGDEQRLTQLTHLNAWRQDLRPSSSNPSNGRTTASTSRAG
jgi:hypothetical protein